MNGVSIFKNHELMIIKKGAVGKFPDSPFLTLLREMGLEPTRAYTHKILSLACLPIPALPQVEYQIPTICNISNTQKKVNRFFKFSEKVLFESNKTDTDVSFRSEKVL